MIDYIVNSSKPFPSWIKNHRVFKSLKKIEKVFPQIGLPNFTETITIYPSETIKAHGRAIVANVLVDLTYRAADLKASLLVELSKSGRERNEKCNLIQSSINLLNAFRDSISGQELTAMVDGKCVISAPSDVFNGSSTPLFKKGEAFFKVLAKANQQINDADPRYKLNFESTDAYKQFSALNLPGKAYQMTFSSIGLDGAWDIATASMRGITSCQTWNAGQARGLIGSISSKYVGVVYISGTTDYPPYGKQMIFRSLVRLIINRTTGQPALFMDTVYPTYNTDMFAVVKEKLEGKTGLKLLHCNNANERAIAMRDYHVLNELTRSYLREGEYSYMDSVIPIEARKTPILFLTENIRLSNRRAHFTAKLESLIDKKRASYDKNIKELQAYLAAGEKDKSKKPELIPAFQDLKKGQHAFQNTLNFFVHCAGPHSTTNKPTTYFLLEIFKAIGNTDESFASDRDCDIWLLRNLINGYKDVKAKSWAELQNGSWMKSFPSSAKRFHETILLDLKKELLLACKGK